MFENTPFTGAPANPLNPPMPGPGLPPTGSLPPTPPPATTPGFSPQVHAMPERFRAGGSGSLGGGPSGKSSTKKLVIILIVVLVVAGLGVAGLFVFQRMNQNANGNTNTVTTNLNRNTNTNANANANTNVNLNTNTGLGNENVNTAANLNVTTNANVNAANTNVDSNVNVVSNTNTATNTNTSTTGTPLPLSVDTDADGLTDVEETVYGTDASKPDSDNDTFIDGKQVRADGSVIGEVYNGFNPAGQGKLEGSTLVKRQANGTQEYNLLIPSAWTATADSSGGLLIMPSQQTGESFQLRINDNPSRLAAKDWYKSISPDSNVDNLTVISVNGLEALQTEDLSTIYFFKDAKVYSLQYQTGTLSQVNFRATVDMMVRSFTLGAAS